MDLKSEICTALMGYQAYLERLFWSRDGWSDQGAQKQWRSIQSKISSMQDERKGTPKPGKDKSSMASTMEGVFAALEDMGYIPRFRIKGGKPIHVDPRPGWYKVIVNHTEMTGIFGSDREWRVPHDDRFFRKENAVKGKDGKYYQEETPTHYKPMT